MIVLHALWNKEAGKLHLWAESSLEVPQRKQRKELPHPFALNHHLLLSVDNLSDLESASLGSMRILLPSTSRGPVPSPELLTERNEEKMTLRWWDVPTVILEPYAALDFLLSLPVHPPSGVRFGSSLQFWVEAARFSIELVTRQCFIPTVKFQETHQAVWETVVDGEDEERIHALSRVMPPVCRALSSELPSELVTDFVNKTADAFVRKTAGHVLSYSPTSLPEQFLRALSSDNSQLSGSPRELKAFSNEIETWLNQIKPDSSPFRICFKLDPPDDNGGEWVINYFLQAHDDPTVLIPASQIWKASEGVTFLKRRCENPQELFLTGLGKASRLYPSIEESLKTAHPSMLTLTSGEAYTYLREAAPLLEQSGFGVLLPAWWQKPQARLGVKLKVRPQKSLGLFGLNSIVEYDWRVALGDETLSLEDFEELVQLKTPLVKTRGQWVELRPEEIEKAIQFFKKKHGGEMTLGDALRLGLGQEQSEVGLPVVDVEGEKEVKMILEGLTSKMTLVEPPETFKGDLRPYQVKGVSWLTFLNTFGLGACLADDMGLGKTVEVIALLLRERENDTAPTLVICPMSVVGNWQREIERFAPSLRVMVHHGTDRLSDSFQEEVKKYDIVITTYSLINRDEKYLYPVEWERVIVDEAQNIKNPWAKQTQAIKRIRAGKKIALTGTPVENRLSELWSIMDFLNKGYLRSEKDFQTFYAVPIERHRNSKRAEMLKKMIQPFVLRRLKTDRTIIQDLPEKMEMKVFCNLTKEQATLYEAVVQEMMEKIENSEGIERKGLVLATLMKIKQICNHPALFLHNKSKLPGRSGKFSRMEEMLEEALSEGDKALIFTQFAEMGGMLHEYLQEKLGCETLFLHGGTSKKKRDEMIERFQSEKVPLFVLSLKAGGFGLNLTAANHVFHFDRWWNPAVENQATDRAFRIGQTKNVQVHKFVTIGTVEERIDTLIEKKKELADTIVGSGEGWITEMSADQLRELFSMSRDALGGE